MLIPLRTDAPVYHLPWATGGIMLACLAALIWEGFADNDTLDALILTYGTFNPLQWLSSVFLHQGWLHLIGNMIFLWIFGLVVEGKVGWWRFLAIYGLIALVSGCVEQVIMLGSDGGSLGASGVIFGLMGIAMVWAPENEIDCLLLLLPWVRRFDISIKVFAGIYILLQFIDAAFAGFAMSTPILHLLGMAAGLPIGVVMVKRNWVDCEGWDWFSRRARNAPAPKRRAADQAPAAAPAPAKAKAAPAAPAPERSAELAAANRETFAELVAAGSLEPALALWRNAGGARLGAPVAQRERLAVGLIRAGRQADAKPLVGGILEEDPGHPGMALLQAQWLLQEQRPAKAREVLAPAAPRLAAGRQQELHARLLDKAAELERAGVLEIDH